MDVEFAEVGGEVALGGGLEVLVAEEQDVVGDERVPDVATADGSRGVARSRPSTRAPMAGVSGRTVTLFGSTGT